MTEREILRCVRRWQRRLRLEHYDVDVLLDGPYTEGGVAAAISVAPDHPVAEIRLHEGWRDWTAEKAGPDSSPEVEVYRPPSLDLLVCHELLHVHSEDVFNAGRLPAGLLGQTAERLHADRLHHDLERMVDSLARVLVAAYGPDLG